MKNICPVCNYPIRKPNRTVHVTCEPHLIALESGEQTSVPEVVSLMLNPDGRECCFCHSRDTRMINGAPFCPEHEPGDVQMKPRSRDVLTLVPDVCVGCGEFLTPGITKGKIKCKCDQPKMPRHLRNNDSDDRPPMSVRYGN